MDLKITKTTNTDLVKGKIIAKALTYPERIAYSKKALVTTAPENAGEQEITKFKINHQLDQVEEYYHLAVKQALVVDVKITKGDEEIHCTSIEELMIYEEGQEFVMSLATELISGITLGNLKPKTSEGM
jgi:hypothetical protein